MPNTHWSIYGSTCYFHGLTKTSTTLFYLNVRISYFESLAGKANVHSFKEVFDFCLALLIRWFCLTDQRRAGDPAADDATGRGDSGNERDFLLPAARGGTQDQETEEGEMAHTHTHAWQKCPFSSYLQKTN